MVQSMSGERVTRKTGSRRVEKSRQLRLDFDPAPVPGADATPRDAPASRRAAPRLATVTSVLSPDGWFEQGVRLEEQGHLEEAAAAYRQALDDGEPSAEISFNLGNVLHALGKVEEAIACYRRALELEPDYVEAWNNLASVHAELEHWSEAIEAGRRALALAPDYPDTHYNLAEAYFACGHLQDARRHGRIYLSYDIGSEWARRLRWKLGLSRG
jgi:tetratricopeptide (TPR) repeat protein